ncbi:MAG TPA: transglutaminaseTgpA domain-containing protein [Candidatus Obscuribacterales bacterium]
MIEHRPSSAYLLLLVLALGGWCLHAPQRLLPAAVLFALVLASYLFPTRLLRPRLFAVIFGSLLGFTFCHFVLLAGQPQVHVSIYSFHVIQSACLTLLVLIGLQWISWRSAQFDWLLFSISSLLMFSGVSWQTLQHKPLFIWLVLSFMGILLIFRLFPRFRTHHPPPEPETRRTLRIYYQRMGLVLVLFLGLSLSAIKSMEFLDRHFSELLTRFLMGSDNDWSGFSGHTFLQGGKEIQLSEQIAFTLKTPHAEDYWRGNILTIYRDGHWFPQETLHLPVPAHGPDGPWQLYNVDPATAGSGELVEVQMQNHYHGILFAPAGTQQVEVPVQTSLYQNQYQLFRRELRQNRHNYRLYQNRSAELPARWDRSILGENLDIPHVMRASLAPLAARISHGPAMERARQIESWFHNEFTYSLKVAPVTPGLDPTLDFILNRKPAYCSWFASGMVLMLRSIGIPAHIVSGWRSMEWNPLARVWVVKEKQAHDWVEVLDAEHNRWLRFDPTPPGQIDELTGAHSWHFLRQLSEGLGILVSQLQQQLGQMSLQQRLEWLRTVALGLLRQPIFYLLLLVVLGLNQLLKLRKRPATSAAVVVPGLLYAGADAETRRCLEQLEPWLQQRQLSLPHYQTLEAWLPQAMGRLSPDEAAQLSEILALLQELRFGKETATVVPQLQDCLAKLDFGARSAAAETI